MIVGTKKTVTHLCKSFVCDLCNQPIQLHGWDESQATVEVKAGDVFPECDCRKVRWIDVCVDCFEEKVIPAIETLGVAFRERRNDDYEYCDKEEPK